MSDHEQQYFLARAEAEKKAAERARHPNAVRAHSTLAGCYLDRAHSRQFAAVAEQTRSEG